MTVLSGTINGAVCTQLTSEKTNGLDRFKLGLEFMGFFREKQRWQNAQLSFSGIFNVYVADREK